MRVARHLFWKRLVRRVMVWGVVPAAVLLGFRLYWGWHAQRRLDAAVGNLRAMHVRMEVEDYPDAEGVPAGENGVAVLLAGPTEISWTNQAAYELIDYPLEFQLREDREAILKMLSVHQEFLDRIDAAGECRSVVWPRSLFSSRSVPLQFDLMPFGELILKGARITYEQHDEALALKQLNRLSALSHILQHSPFIKHQYLAQRLHDLAADGIEKLESGLTLQDPAAAEQAERLIARLLDDAWIREGSSTTLEAQLAVDKVFSKNFTELNSQEPWILEPLATEATARWLKDEAGRIAAFRETSLSAFMRQSDELRASWDRELDGDLFPSGFGRDGDRYLRNLEYQAHGRACAMLLAARLYEATHAALPATADEFLKTVPRDPFGHSGEAMGYRVDLSGPTVWSMGPDGRSENGNLIYGSARIRTAPVLPTATRAAGRVASPSTTTRSATVPASGAH